jgi:eukaryotic-like serine/threonine-protein kinase
VVFPKNWRAKSAIIRPAPLYQLLFSVGTMLGIYVLVTIAGFRIGVSYQFESCEKTRRWIGIGHFISGLIIAGTFWFFYQIVISETADAGMISTIYAFLGVQGYLFLSSILQAVSIFRVRPLPPIYHIHVLFVFIAISLMLMSRAPFIPPLSLAIPVITTIYLPGAILSLLTGQIIRRVSDSLPADSHMTVTYTGSRIQADIASSFPEVLRSRYENCSIVGSGGVAIVYRALRIDNGKEVALKIPFSADETTGKTFLNELSIWRDLHHPCIVEVFDQNIFPVPYVEMEYLSRTLRDMTYPLAPARAIAIITDIGSALMYAHDKGVIHRDIKPGNVLLTSDGRAKLTDWGLSRSLFRADETKNTSFSLFYATPEQLAPDMYGSGDQRTDLYQLGVLLYEMICGEPPYTHAGVGEIFMAIQQNRYRLPSSYDQGLTGFDEIIMRSLRAQPDERYASVEEFMEDVKKVQIS